MSKCCIQNSPGSVLPEIRRVLREELYVVAEVEEQLLDYFALNSVRPVRPEGTILCLCGSPGTGKTDIIRSLAKSLALEVIVIPIGSVSSGDNGGHRRADLNATAGRIIHALNASNAEHIMVLLENIDQLDRTGMNNPSVDFFEVLKFMEDYARKNNYQTEALDYTKITFSATAQNLSLIPSGIRAQMSVVIIPSYTGNNKLLIACRYLVPRLLQQYGLVKTLAFPKDSLSVIIRDYTREAGIDGLRRHLERICRKRLRQTMDESGVQAITISPKNIAEYLGPPQRRMETLSKFEQVGVVTVLGRSNKGGFPVSLEVLKLPGDGNLTMSGNLDQMFKESTLVAMNYVRSQAVPLGVSEDFHKTNDFHFHMLSATTPKYGVSAGVGIVTALVSALTEYPISNKVGMSGEISLYGRILAVQDIRDKVLGGYQIGLTTFFLPRENEVDIARLPKELTALVEIIMVENIVDLLQAAIVWGPGDGVNHKL